MQEAIAPKQFFVIREPDEQQMEEGQGSGEEMGGNARRAEPKQDINRRISYAGREREEKHIKQEQKGFLS